MDDVLETGDVKRLRRQLRDAVKARGWLAVTGDAGTGKTVAVSEILRGEAWLSVQPPCLDASRITIHYVLSSIVEGLQGVGCEEGEKPRRSLQALEIQTSRVLGVASAHHEIVLCIEEAHRLHWRTLCSLKRLRELAFAGVRSPMLTIVLVGQPELRNVLAIRREVNYRCRRTDVRGLTPGEFTAFASAQGWGKRATPAAIERLESLTWDEQYGRSYIESMAKFDEACDLAAVRGKKHADVADVDDVFTSLKSRLVKCGLSLGQLAQKIGRPKSSLHAALDRGSGQDYEAARSAIEDAERKVG